MQSNCIASEKLGQLRGADPQGAAEQDAAKREHAERAPRRARVLPHPGRLEDCEHEREDEDGQQEIAGEPARVGMSREIDRRPAQSEPPSAPPNACQPAMCHSSHSPMPLPHGLRPAAAAEKRAAAPDAGGANGSLQPGPDDAHGPERAVPAADVRFEEGSALSPAASDWCSLRT